MTRPHVFERCDECAQSTPERRKPIVFRCISVQKLIIFDSICALPSGLKQYEIDAFISRTKTSFLMSLGASEWVSEWPTTHIRILGRFGPYCNCVSLHFITKTNSNWFHLLTAANCRQSSLIGVSFPDWPCGTRLKIIFVELMKTDYICHPPPSPLKKDHSATSLVQS